MQPLSIRRHPFYNRGQMKDNRIYPEYVTCSWCGHKKYCKLEDRKWVCKACDTTHPAGVDREHRV